MARLRALLNTTRLYYTQALAVELLYRFALVQAVFGVAIGIAGLVVFWLAAGRSAGSGSAYQSGEIVAYFLVASAHAIVHDNHLSANLSTAIRMGKLSASMLRPYPFLASLAAQTAAQATVRFAFVAPLVAAISLSFSVVRPIFLLAPQRLAWYLVALLLSLFIGWLVKVIFGLLAFDMTQTWGPELILLSIFAAASGTNYPPDLLSPAVAAVVMWTPVYYMVGFPTLVLLGRIPASELLSAFARGGVVAVISLLVVVLLWQRGIRRFEAVGI